MYDKELITNVLEKLAKEIIEQNLDAYTRVSYNVIERVPGSLSIVYEDDGYSVYLTGERGNVVKRGSNLSEEGLRNVVLQMLKRNKSLAEYYILQGKAEENGVLFNRLEEEKGE